MENRDIKRSRNYPMQPPTISLECRNCHDLDYMDFTVQRARAEQAQSTFLASGERTCIECHKGIAHHLLDMEGVEGWAAAVQ